VKNHQRNGAQQYTTGISRTVHNEPNTLRGGMRRKNIQINDFEQIWDLYRSFSILVRNT
jgi:hypothetical protein